MTTKATKKTATKTSSTKSTRKKRIPPKEEKTVEVLFELGPLPPDEKLESGLVEDNEAAESRRKEVEEKAATSTKKQTTRKRKNKIENSQKPKRTKKVTESKASSVEGKELSEEKGTKEVTEIRAKKTSKGSVFMEFEIPVEKIVLGEHQPRSREGLESRGSLTRLKENIRDVGLLQPILVEQEKDGTYLLISGERRLRASMQLGHKKIRAVLPSNRTVRSIEKDGRTLQEIALFENVRRKDLTAIEEGRTFEQLISLLNVSQEELGKRLGFDQAYISQRISFLHLPEEVQEMIEEEKINTTQAREIARLRKIRSKKKREEAQIKVAKQIEVEKLTYRKAKFLVDNLLGEKTKRDSSQLTRLGAKKAIYFISVLNKKFDEIVLEELKGEEEQGKLKQLIGDLPALIEKLGQLQQKAEKIVEG